MSKRTRHADNSKRQQPTQQSRAQASLPGTSRTKVARLDERRSGAPAGERGGGAAPQDPGAGGREG